MTTDDVPNRIANDPLIAADRGNVTSTRQGLLKACEYDGSDEELLALARAHRTAWNMWNRRIANLVDTPRPAPTAP